jgi:NAD(P)-dependent dehydrogenase (short-subunit alcohol dehydrogenase family)
MTGTFLTLKHAAPAMRRAGGGSFIAISSVAGVRPVTWLSAYNAAKAGVDQLVRSAAEELGPHRIRVNSVLPGYVPTGLNAEATEDNAIGRAFVANMPLGRVGRPDDVAEAVRFLAGPESSWITGVTLFVDGGHHLRSGAGLYDSFVAEEHGTDWFPKP